MTDNEQVNATSPRRHQQYMFRQRTDKRTDKETNRKTMQLHKDPAISAGS